MKQHNRSQRLQTLREKILADKKQQLFEKNFDFENHEQAKKAFLEGEQAKVEFNIQLPKDEELLDGLRKDNAESIASNKWWIKWGSIVVIVSVIVLICPGVWTYINSGDGDFFSVTVWAPSLIGFILTVPASIFFWGGLFTVLPDLYKDLRKKKALA